LVGVMSRRDGGRGAEASEQILAFSRGLYPILLRADPVAFSRYLSQWEDVIGDTTELAATPPDQLRRTMAALLRRPQQFGLPPWPATPLPPAARTAALDETLLTPEGNRRPRGDAGHSRVSTAPSGAPGGLCPPEEQNASSGDDVTAAPRVYQLDMLTGELVPVPETPATGSVAEPPPAPYGTEEVARPARRRRPRRRAPAGLEQLAFWPADNHSSDLTVARYRSARSARRRTTPARPDTSSR
jgi:hypothetical protein